MDPQWKVQQCFRNWVFLLSGRDLGNVGCNTSRTSGIGSKKWTAVVLAKKTGELASISVWRNFFGGWGVCTEEWVVSWYCGVRCVDMVSLAKLRHCYCTIEKNVIRTHQHWKSQILLFDKIIMSSLWMLKHLFKWVPIFFERVDFLIRPETTWRHFWRLFNLFIWLNFWFLHNWVSTQIFHHTPSLFLPTEPSWSNKSMSFEKVTRD